MIDEPTDRELPTDEVSESVQAEAPKAPPSMDGNGKSDTISDRVQKSRDVIPIGDRGPTPSTYAQWIDIAKDVCKAYLMLPEHLHNNPPVMAGLLEISARFNLSPYMLASKTYVQNNRLCFESQAFGAILYASRLLLGRLRFEFHGEGEDMTCTVSGRFRDDPGQICMATTPPLKLLHPGYSQREGKGKFVKGSPLWDKDPEQQMAYFAQRRWTRRFAPDCVAGMYTKEEAEEMNDRMPWEAVGAPLTADRLGQLDTGEGWGEGEHVDADLASIALEDDFAQAEPELPPKPPAKSLRPARRKPVQARKPPARGKQPPARKKSPASSAKPRQGRSPSRAVVQAVVKRAEAPPRRVQAAPPKWLDYVQQADVWITAAIDAGKAEARWDKERDERDNLQVPMGERSRLRAILDRKVAQLKPKLKQEDG